MQCLVLVKFMDKSSLTSAEFFDRIDAKWSLLEYKPTMIKRKVGNPRPGYSPKLIEAICIADHESVTVGH